MRPASRWAMAATRATAVAHPGSCGTGRFLGAVVFASQRRPASTARSLLCRIRPALTRVMALATIRGPSPRISP
jgi:hypothetical protein